MSDSTPPTQTVAVHGDLGFRLLMGQVAAGVCVLTTVHDGHDQAITVTTLTSVSLSPPLVLVCIDRRSRFHTAVLGAQVFGASILSATQGGLSTRFATRGRPVADQLDGVTHTRGETGAALLDGAVGQLEARVEFDYGAGDHSIVVGRVIAASVATTSGPALVHHRSGYCSVG